MKGPHVSARGVFVLSGAAIAFLAAWGLPGPKSDPAVDGRLNYVESLLALLSGGALVSTAVVVLMPPACRRAVGFRLSAVWLGAVAAALAVEVAAYWLPQRHSLDNPWYLMTGQGVEPADDLPFERPAHLHWEG